MSFRLGQACFGQGNQMPYWWFANKRQIVRGREPLDAVCVSVLTGVEQIKLTCLTQHFTNCTQLKQFYLTILRCTLPHLFLFRLFSPHGISFYDCWIFKPHDNSNMDDSLLSPNTPFVCNASFYL